MIINVNNTSKHLPRITPQFSSVQLLSPVRLLVTPWISMPGGLPVHHRHPEFTQTHVLRVSDAIQPSHPLSSPSPNAPNPSQHQGLFHWVNSSHQVAKEYWSFSFSISPSNKQLGMISFRIDWLDLLAGQGTLKSLQHHSSKASVLWCSPFFGLRVSPTLTSKYDYWKNHSFD